MDIAVAGRRCAIPAPVRERMRERFRRLARFERRPRRAEVIFESDHGVRQLEARLLVADGAATVARGRGETFPGAPDRVVDRVGRRLERCRERRRDRQAVRRYELQARAGDG